MGTCGITRSSVTTQRATGPTSLHGQLAMRKGQCRRRRHPAKIASKLPVNNDLNVQAIDPSCQSQYRHTRVKSLFSSALTRRISTRFVTVADTCQLPARSVQETETGIQRCYKTSRSCRGRTASRSLCCKQRWVLSVISTVDNTCEVAMVNKPWRKSRWKVLWGSTTPRESEIWGFCRQHLAILDTLTIRSIKCKQSPVYGVFWPLLPHPSTDRNETRTWSSLWP